MAFNHLPWYAQSWDFFRKWKAIGSLPMLRSVDHARGIARSWGFAESHPAPGVERWQHPDGSYMEFVYGRPSPRLGWYSDDWNTSFDLGRLPYNNRTG
ncbi:MAG: hypothetical protein HY903_08420 [Deltaproteobacteria bacterium]|nr:hypothetical protein [Deltaproteobacteria bacterium]